MPYKRIGKIVYTKSSGKWKKKQTCTSIANAKKALALLEDLEKKKPSKGKAAFKKKSSKKKKSK